MNNNETVKLIAKLIGGTVAPANEIVIGDRVLNSMHTDLVVDTIEIVTKNVTVPYMRVNDGECVYQLDQLVCIV